MARRRLLSDSSSSSAIGSGRCSQSRLTLSRMCPTRAITWTSEPGSPSMMRSGMVGQSLLSRLPLLLTSPTRTCSADIARCLDESPGDVTAAQHREGASELVGQSPQPLHLGLRLRAGPDSNHNTGTTPPPREPRAAAHELF